MFIDGFRIPRRSTNCKRGVATYYFGHFLPKTAAEWEKLVCPWCSLDRPMIAWNPMNDKYPITFHTGESLNKWYFWFIMPLGVVGNIISFVVRTNFLCIIFTKKQRIRVNLIVIYIKVTIPSSLTLLNVFTESIVFDKKIIISSIAKTRFGLTTKMNNKLEPCLIYLQLWPEAKKGNDYTS